MYLQYIEAWLWSVSIVFPDLLKSYAYAKVWLIGR